MPNLAALHHTSQRFEMVSRQRSRTPNSSPRPAHPDYSTSRVAGIQKMCPWFRRGQPRSRANVFWSESATESTQWEHEKSSGRTKAGTRCCCRSRSAVQASHDVCVQRDSKAAGRVQERPAQSACPPPATDAEQIVGFLTDRPPTGSRCVLGSLQFNLSCQLKRARRSPITRFARWQS